MVGSLDNILIGSLPDCDNIAKNVKVSARI